MLNPDHPILDRMFGYKCNLAVYQSSPHNSIAVTGDGWVIPETGEAMTGSNNSCQVTTLPSIAHQYGVKAYLTLGVDASQHTPWQVASYLKRAVDNPGLLDIIVQKATQGGYDGVLLDYETVDANFPDISKVSQEYSIKLRMKLQTQNPPLELGKANQHLVICILTCPLEGEYSIGQLSADLRERVRYLRDNRECL